MSAAATEFVYAASLMGVTGVRTSMGAGAADLVARIRPAAQVPVAVGIGVSTPEQAHEVAQFADGVIVGSAFVRRVLDAADPQAAVAASVTSAGELRSRPPSDRLISPYSCPTDPSSDTMAGR